MQYSQGSMGNIHTVLQFRLEGISRHELDMFYDHVTGLYHRDSEEIPPTSLFDFSHGGIVLTPYLERILGDLFQFLENALPAEHAIVFVTGTQSLTNSLRRIINEHIGDNQLMIEVFPTHTAALRWLSAIN